MRIMRNLAFLALLLLPLAACGTVEPDAGYEAVLIQKPMFFGSGGVVDTPVHTGLTYVAWTTSADYVYMQPRRIDVEFDDLMTFDGVPIDFHAVLSYQVLDSVKLVKLYGNDEQEGAAPGWFRRNLEQPFRTLVRDEVKRHGMNEMAIQATAAEQVDLVVTGHMEELIKSTGVPVKLIDLSLGRANPPDAILHQRIATAEQEQRINTEKQRKLAEDQRKMAEESRASADAAYNYKMELSPSQYLQLETIKMQKEVCVKGGCYFGFSPTFTQGLR